MNEIIYFVNRCEYLPEDFFKTIFKDCEIIDSCIVKLSNGKEYFMQRCEPYGIVIQRDIEIYRLVEPNISINISR